MPTDNPRARPTNWKKHRSALSAALIILYASIGSCGGSGGACVTGPEGDALCEEGWERGECEAGTGWTYYEGKTCRDIGYTKPCSKEEGAGCFCRSTDTSCP